MTKCRACNQGKLHQTFVCALKDRRLPAAAHKGKYGASLLEGMQVLKIAAMCALNALFAR